MPPLRRPENAGSVNLPPRVARLAAETDVLVVGGGPAGLGAALGAAKAGARVVLTERYGFLGGNATAALVMPLMSFHTQEQRRRKTRRGHVASYRPWRGRACCRWSGHHVPASFGESGGRHCTFFKYRLRGALRPGNIQARCVGSSR